MPVAVKLNWGDFFDTANVPSIGYDMESDSLIIAKGCDVSKDVEGQIYHYDLKLECWTSGYQVYSVASDRSNFQTTAGGQLLTIDKTGGFYVWDGSPSQQTEVDIRTKRFDFGAPAVEKKIYKIYVEYKSPSYDNNMVVSYDENQDNNFDGYVGTLPLANSYTTEAFTFSTPVECKHFALKFASGAASISATFEISGISILYRMMRVK